MVKVAGYTYYYVTTVGPKTRWRCSTHSSRGCSAHLYTINDTLFATKGPLFMLSERGARILVVDGYKFRRQCDVGTKTRWWCSSHYNRGCRAVVYTIGTQTIRCKNIHTHAPVHIYIIKRVKRRMRYKREGALVAASEAVLSGKMSCLRAANLYEVPRTTLRRKIAELWNK
ncbi:hypothetical protein RR46_03794 [Papilio xuthus]|uniref:FLYWCH-type domain-containing protein n=1 Tax=Papilio xuthus TaxID=66420 RepID=A0A194Q348_PAPXU|nr:hypothetical protein RR46_03794 [Papilio xuthus]